MNNCNNLAKKKERKKDGSWRYSKFCTSHHRKEYGSKMMDKGYRNTHSGRIYTRERYKNLPCLICGWSLTRCDKHRIIPGKEGGKYNIKNIIPICPNCHRLVHDKMEINPEIVKKFLVEILERSCLSQRKVVGKMYDPGS